MKKRSFTTELGDRLGWKALLVIAATIALVSVLLLLPQPAQKAKGTLIVQVPEFKQGTEYTVDVYDQTGALIRRQGGSHSEFTFAGVAEGKVSVVVTDSSGRVWSSGVVGTSEWSTETRWVEITGANPQPKGSFYAEDVINKNVVVLPEGVSLKVGNAIHVNPCFTVIDVFNCTNSTNSTNITVMKCVRVDGDISPYATYEMTYYDYLGACIKQDLVALGVVTTNVTANGTMNLTNKSTTKGINETTYSCSSIAGDLNGDKWITQADLELLGKARAYVEEYGVMPNGANCADVNGDGAVTQEDYECVGGLIAGTYSSASECPKCKPTSPLEICHDGVDNDCDGQTDRESYDSETGTMYGTLESPIDVCECNNMTPGGIVYDVDGLPGWENEDGFKICRSWDNSPFEWYTLYEWECSLFSPPDVSEGEQIPFWISGNPAEFFLRSESILVHALLPGGGAIDHLQYNNSPNLVNNFDYGRFIQLDLRDNALEGTQLWEVWNPTQGGRVVRDGVEGGGVERYRHCGDSLYTKTRAYHFRDGLSNVSIEQWTRLYNPDVIEVKYRVEYEEGEARYGCHEAPAVWTNDGFEKVFFYAGQEPFTGDNLTNVSLVGRGLRNPLQLGGPYNDWSILPTGNLSEGWVSITNASNMGITLYSKEGYDYFTLGDVQGDTDNPTFMVAKKCVELTPGVWEYRYFIIPGYPWDAREIIYALAESCDPECCAPECCDENNYCSPDCCAPECCGEEP